MIIEEGWCKRTRRQSTRHGRKIIGWKEDKGDNGGFASQSHRSTYINICDTPIFDESLGLVMFGMGDAI